MCNEILADDFRLICVDRIEQGYAVMSMSMFNLSLCIMANYCTVVNKEKTLLKEERRTMKKCIVLDYRDAGSSRI